MSAAPILDISDLKVDFETPDGTVNAVQGISMHVSPGETVAVVGESGSGKSQVMMAAMGLLAANGQARGAVRYRGDEILNSGTSQLNRLRGSKITMIFQEPMTSLDPLYWIEDQLAEPLMVHGGLTRTQARARILDLLRKVKIPDPERRMKAYPYELSGGQRQRVMIAMALANDPDLLIADEPTTALDVTIQAEILQLLAELQAEQGMSILFITHDLGIVRAFADRVYVMRRGRVVETGETSQIFTAPRTGYTRMLLDAEPSGAKEPVPPQAPTLLQGDDISVTFGHPAGLLRKDTLFTAVQSVDLTLKKGQTIGIVGESGSGKSTLGRAMLRLLPADGQIVYLERDITYLVGHELKPMRKGMQMVFQDPYGSLSPRMTVGEIITEGLLVHDPGLSKRARAERASDALRDVGLEASMRNRFPHEFSGGQRQRIAIARAVILRPQVIVLDEPTSALDRTVQKQVIELLRRLQAEYALSYVFISHDLAVVRALADYIVVMKDGRVVEEGLTESVFDAPKVAYTQQLLTAAFSLDNLLKKGVA